MSDSQQQGPAFPIIKFEEFKTLNTESARAAIADDEMSWIDGFMPLGGKELRTLPDVGASIFTAPGGTTIGYFAAYNIGIDPYLIIFPTDGSIWALNTNTLVSSNIATAGTVTVTVSQRNIGVGKWGPFYILIVTSQANGYFAWDGTTFYRPGDSVPDFGTMPTGIQGQALDTYQNRVWITDVDNCYFSAPQSFTDFTTANGGGDFTSSDAFLVASYIQPKQNNGFLYLIADSSINYISNVQTSGSPVITTFTNQNANAEIGTPWAATVATWGSNILLSNTFGVHISYGGQVTKISTPLDGVYSTATPFFSVDNNFSAGKVTLYGKKCYVILSPIIDPYTGNIVNKFFLWNGDRWWASSQSVALLFIASEEKFSEFNLYGTDGTLIYPMFTTPSDALKKVVQSKLWSEPAGFHIVKGTDRVWALAKYYSNTSPDLTVFIDNQTAARASTILSPDPTTATVGYYLSPPTALAQYGGLLGVTVETNAADMALIGVSFDATPIEYRG